MVHVPGEQFKACRGWFDNFKKRTGIHSVVRHAEAASLDVKAAEDFVKTFLDLTNKDTSLSKFSTVMRLGHLGRR